MSSSPYLPLSQKLVKWFESEQRPLPWRTSPRKPYPSLVSEFMLQQTTVATVVPKFNEFIKKFPSIEALGHTSEDEVVAAWQGLGYYRRARFLHRIAKELTRQGQTQIPSSQKELMELPGIGRYTAGAILSIVYGQAVPLVDGNVIRVLSRLFGISHRNEKKFYEIASHWVQISQNPSAHNEGLMELGALVCRPQNPVCHECPLRSQCIAYREDRVDQLPVTLKRTKIIPTHRVLALLTHKEKILVFQTGLKNLCQGQWNGWLSEPVKTTHVTKALTKMSRQVSQLESQAQPKLKTLGIIKHAVYNEAMSVHVCQVSIRKEILPKHFALGQGQWAKISHLPQPTSTLLKKGISLLPNSDKMSL